MPSRTVRALVIGGGFFGSMIAIRLGQAGVAVTLVERDDRLMGRASYVNQARIHGGYHYPRSIVTARRSRVNFARFRADFPTAVVGDVRHVYAIARHGSKVSAGQFAAFCERIGAPLAPAPRAVAALFNPRLIDAAFVVDEAVFDADALRASVTERLTEAGVSIQFGVEVTRVSETLTGLRATCRSAAPGAEARDAIEADHVFDCTYAGLNVLRSASGLARLPLKLEQAEIAVLRVPPDLSAMGVTVMDGPYFSVMPFPPAAAHSLTHVRYTPRRAVASADAGDPAWAAQVHVGLAPTTQAQLMLRDAQRYLPVLAEATLTASWIEAKSVLVATESDDARPIVLDRPPALRGFVSILGSKIDNVYDVLDAIETISLAGAL